jgi:hypothetical protein
MRESGTTGEEQAMKAMTKILAGAAALGALVAAAPAAAQYYPGYGYGYGYPGYGYGGVVGSIVNSVTRPYGGGYDYNVPGASHVAANQCTAAAQQRLSGYGGYGYGAGYGRVLGVTSVEIRPNGGYRVRGNAVAGSGYGYGGGTLQFTCRTDPRGLVMDVDFNNRGYGQGYYGNGYDGAYYNDPVEAYGYRRY